MLAVDAASRLRSPTTLPSFVGKGVQPSLARLNKRRRRSWRSHGWWMSFVSKATSGLVGTGFSQKFRYVHRACGISVNEAS
jgi:hypothetical protein